MMKCRNCGAEVGPGARFCAQCGTEIKAAEPAAKFCSQCGAKLGENALFCAQCGAPVGGRAPQQPQSPAPETKPTEHAQANAGERAPENAAPTQNASENGRASQNFNAPAPGAHVLKICPECGTKTGVEVIYCPKCARLLSLKSISGEEFQRLKMMSFYEGEPSVGISKATGDLVICDDRIVFEKKMGNAMGNAFGLIGMGIARRAIRDNPVDTYMLSEVASAREGKYMAVMPMIVITLKDGRVVSFCGTAGSARVDKAVKLIEEYKNYA